MKNAFKKHKYIYVALVLVLIVGGYYWYKKSHATTAVVQYKTTTVEKGTLTTSVSASGNIIVDNSASIDPDINGTVANLSVNIGDSVKKGQFLFSIVNDQLGLSVSQAESSYQSAQSSLISAQSSYKDLKNSNTSTSADRKAAKSKVASAEYSLQSSLASLNYQKQQAGKRNVASTIDGTVNAINVKNGDNLGASSSTHTAPIIIGDLNTLKAQVQVNEVDISNVSVGQKVSLTFDALPDYTTTGKVEKVDSLGTTTQGVVTYNVTIGMDDLDPRIKSDMSVTAAIITSLKQDVITVPVSAVKTQNGSSYVEILNSGTTPTQAAVEIGASNDTSMEITSGVNVGDKVVTQTINPNATSTTSTSTGGGGNNPARALRGFGG
jgi:HlyD family secretion protein